MEGVFRVGLNEKSNGFLEGIQLQFLLFPTLIILRCILSGLLELLLLFPDEQAHLPQGRQVEFLALLQHFLTVISRNSLGQVQQVVVSKPLMQHDLMASGSLPTDHLQTVERLHEVVVDGIESLTTLLWTLIVCE